MTSRYDMYAVRYPLLPLKNVVIFPRNVVTLLVGKVRSIQSIEAAMSRDRRIVVVAHRDPQVDDPTPDDLYDTGTLAEIVSIEHQQGGNIQVALEGLHRVRIIQSELQGSFYKVRAEQAVESPVAGPETQALVAHIQQLATSYQELKNAFSRDVYDMIQATTDPSHLADVLTTQLIRDAGQRQQRAGAEPRQHDLEQEPPVHHAAFPPAMRRDSSPTSPAPR